jgi:DNA-binding protein
LVSGQLGVICSFGAGYSIGNVKIDSESLESEDGRTRNVSTIEIEVKRNAE